MREEEYLEFRISGEEEGMRLDRFLKEKIPWRSRANLQKLIHSGEIRVNQHSRKSSSELKEGDVVCTSIRNPAAVISEVDPKQHLDILYEDETAIAVNKPAGMATIPTSRHVRNNLVGFLRVRYSREEEPFQPVHRLDRETSGVVLCAKTGEARRAFSLLFEKRRVTKIYQALVHGVIEGPEGRVDVPIGKAEGSRVRIRQAAGRGKPAGTEYLVLRRFEPARISLLQIRLLTGRAHQIRAHMAHIGHPVVGDKIYGSDEGLFLDHLDGKLDDAVLRTLQMPRHALHASTLVFVHPFHGRETRIEAPLAEDMAEMIREMNPCQEDLKKL